MWKAEPRRLGGDLEQNENPAAPFPRNQAAGKKRPLSFLAAITEAAMREMSAKVVEELLRIASS
jgi:hypothetical protein